MNDSSSLRPRLINAQMHRCLAGRLPWTVAEWTPLGVEQKDILLAHKSFRDTASGNQIAPGDTATDIAIISCYHPPQP